MAKRTVTADVYNWNTPIEGAPGQFQFHTARRGDVIDVSDDEAARGDELGALADEDTELPAGAASSAYPAEETALVAGISRPAEPGGDEGLDLSNLVAGPNASIRPDAAGAGAAPTGAPGDAELAAMNAEELVAYLNQHPDEVDRVEAVEQARSKPRSSVLGAVENHRTAGE